MYYLKIGTYTGSLNKFTIFAGMSIGFLFGEWNELLTALLVLQGVDILLGLLTAAERREISSNIMLFGVKRKVGVWLSLILSNVIDGVLFEGQPVATTGLAFTLISYEGLSIAENLGILGVPLPKTIKKYLKQIRDCHGENGCNEPEIDKVFLQDENGKIQKIENGKIHSQMEIKDYHCENCKE